MNYWERLMSLNVTSKKERKIHVLQIFKILHGICPNDLNIQFAPPSRLGVKAIIPNLKRAASQRHQTLYDKSFAVLGPRLCNSIPTELTQVGFRQQFKNSLTNYLLLIPDQPPVLGYCCPNNNSLLSWSENRAESQLLRWSPYEMAC